MLARVPIQQVITNLQEFQTHCPTISEIGISLNSYGELLLWFSEKELDVIYYPEQQKLVVNNNKFQDIPVSNINEILQKCHKSSSTET